MANKEQLTLSVPLSGASWTYKRYANAEVRAEPKIVDTDWKVIPVEEPKTDVPPGYEPLDSIQPLEKELQAALVELAAQLIVQRVRATRLREIINKALIPVKKHATIKCVTEISQIARQLLEIELSTTKEEAKMTSIAMYESIIRDPTATIADKLTAQSRIDKILGLEHRVVGTENNAERKAQEIREFITGLNDAYKLSSSES